MFMPATRPIRAGLPTGNIRTVHVPGGGAADVRDADKQRISIIVDVKTHRLTRLSR